MNLLSSHPNIMKLHLVTLKLSKELSNWSSVFDIFNDRSSCDVFVRSLIVCIEEHNLQLYGFVMLSDQVHLILQPGSDLKREISALKNMSAKMIIPYLVEKLSLFEKEMNGEQPVPHKVIDHFLEADQASIWQNKEVSDELTFDPMPQLDILSAKILKEYLDDSNRNYLHLGAHAFTKLMMDKMKI